MAFVSFMSSPAGRAARVVAGLALIVVGLAVVGGTDGMVLALIGLVPLGAGAADVCLFGPLLGSDLHGTARQR